MDTNENLLNTELQIDTASHAYLAETAKWANFLSIVGFVLSALLAILAVFAGSAISNLGSMYGNGSPMIGAGAITVIYLLIAILYFFMSLYLNRFASKMKTALYSNDQDSLSNSFLNLKSLYKLMGILTLIYLGLLVLGLIVGIGAVLMRG
jgi:hypothetical protein